MKKDQQTLIRMDKEELKNAKKEAKKLGLSLSAFIRLLLRNWYNGIRFERDKNNESS